jgi:DNA-binding transcriptional ArsR family regulator
MTTREQIEFLYAQSIPPCEIIRQTGLASSTVHHHLSDIRRGIPPYDGRRRGAGKGNFLGRMIAEPKPAEPASDPLAGIVDPYPRETAPFVPMYRQRITMDPRRPGEPETIDRRGEVVPWLAR